jgi:lipopolysaccharide biosynthesis glycosyltransferase
MCIKEYRDHSCEKITFEDGPILNEFCKEKMKCINFKYNRVSFHSLLSRFIREVFLNFFASLTEMSYKTGISVIIILISCSLIKKFI